MILVGLYDLCQKRKYSGVDLLKILQPRKKKIKTVAANKFSMRNLER